MSVSVYESVSAPRFVSVQEYEEWVLENWIYPMGSFEAQAHTRDKLDSEIKELQQALGNDDREEIKSELGDVLWTATATARNSGITISDSLKYTFSDEFPKYHILTLADIDEIAATFEVGSEADVRESLDWFGYYLGKASMQWLTLAPLMTGEGDGYILLRERRANEGLATLVMLCSNIAQKYGFSLTEVVEANAQKLQNRLSAGVQVTKVSPDNMYLRRLQN